MCFKCKKYFVKGKKTWSKKIYFQNKNLYMYNNDLLIKKQIQITSILIYDILSRIICLAHFPYIIIIYYNLYKI